MAGIEQPTTEDARPPQFGLKGFFAFITSVAAIAGLAVSQFAGWTMSIVGFALATLNCAGRLETFQGGVAQTRVFRLGWTLLALSLFTPAVKGCGNQNVPGWRAAVLCAHVAIDPPVGEAASKWQAIVLYGWLTLGNALLLCSPFWLRRLQQGRRRLYSILLATTVTAMCSFSIRNTNHFLVGYYLWCLAGLSLLCAFRMRWPTLALMALVLLFVCLT